MRKLWWVVGVVVLGGAGAAAVWAVRAKSADTMKTKPEDVALEFTPSEVTRPVLTFMPERFEFSGPLMAPRMAVVRAKAAGTLLSLNVSEGSRVKAGQSLGSIDLSDLQSRMNERSAGVESAQARLTEAERAHAANENLARQQFISGTALEASKATLEAARAQLKSTQAQLSTSKLGIREAAMTAPISGIVGKRSVLPGEKVAAEQEVITVVDLSTLELVGSVGTHQVSALKPGQAVQVKVEGQSSAVTGRLDRIAPTAEAGTRGIRVVVALSNPFEAFRAGQYASAVVQLEDSAQRLTIPVTAVAQASGQDYVWVIEGTADNPNKRALVRKTVTTGRRDAASGRVEVVQGLTAEAQLLAARFDNLREGRGASVVAAKTAPPASAPAASTPR
jgi:membrane fusion protein, multidrug efflux system